MKFKIVTFLTLLLVVVLLYLEAPYYCFILIAACWIGGLVLGAANVRLRYFMNIHNEGNGKEAEVALTFDDGPDPEYTPQVLDLLKEHNLKATFFLIGKNVTQYPELVQRIVEEGHTIGNHSYTHTDVIAFKVSMEWIKEIQEADEAIMKAVGHKPRFFRPPFGITTPHLAQALQRTKHEPIGWSVRPYDTVKKKTKEEIIQKIESRTQKGSIILLHDTHSRIIPVLKHIIPYVQAKGYNFVPISQLLNISDYDKN